MITLAANGDEKAPENNLLTYIRDLVKSDYVAQLHVCEKGMAETSNGFKVYRLINNTGPLASVLSKGKMVDRNEQGAEGSNNHLSAAFGPLA